eukprot:TRINITY_DN648_c0_g2_i1.p1 TRINITY_DN648_c0_g2~~TRINITY_DN648_c0_g2_i1.p1  ORF type:complete len:261 (+),score=100.57 TRINITY_DN648_c0_g2_i1:74-856(+)
MSKKTNNNNNKNNNKKNNKTKGLPTRDDFHLTRKLFHSVWGLFYFILYCFYLTQQTTLFILTIIFTTILFGEILRKKVKKIQELTMKLFGSVMRQHEQKQISGIVFYLAGCILSIYLFPKVIALFSILCLAIGDPIASSFGIFAKNLQFFKLKTRKSLVGTIAAFLICFILIYYLLNNYSNISTIIEQNQNQNQNQNQIIFVISFIGALTAAIAEASVPTPRPTKFDDNFFIPFATSCSLWLFSKYVLDIDFNQVTLFNQ